MDKANQAPAVPESRLRFAWRYMRWPLILYVIALVAMMFMEDSLLYYPEPYDAKYVMWQPGSLAHEDAWFEAADGTRLHGWYLDHPAPRAVVLMAHGNAGNVALWADLARKWHDDLGVSILLFDYRGYGRSAGKPSEAGLMKDARAARAWLAHRAGVAEKEIVLFGRSIGGAVMADLAAADGARALVLERTFTSIPDVAAHHYPWLPVRLVMRSRYDSLAKIGSYHGPLLMSHGEADSIVPFECGRRLFDAANEPKQFVAVSKGNHNDEQPEDYYRRVDAFLGSLR